MPSIQLVWYFFHIIHRFSLNILSTIHQALVIQTVDSAIQRLNNRSQTAVVQTLYSAIHGMNHYPLDSAIGFFNTYLLDSGLSAG